MVPIPTPSIFIISSPTLNRSPPKNEVIPVNLTALSVVTTSSASVVVIAVETIGDWMRLSMATNTFAFWFVAINVWAAPTPVEVKLITWGTDFRASSALLASLIVLSLILTANRPVGGSSSVVTPVTGNVVWAIPIDCVFPIPGQVYSICSPVT